MYPNLYYLFKDIFTVDLPFLKAISSAGFFMALAFVPATWLWSHELRFKEKNGELTYITKTIINNKGINIGRILLHFILGFITGLKLVGLIIDKPAMNYNNYLFSWQGNYTAAIICGSIWAAYTFYEGHKERSAKSQEEVVKIYPHDYVLKGILVAATSGVIGAKFFGILETWNAFIADPINSIFSSEGFAFLGGFLVATVAMWTYHYRFAVQRMRMADALAPALILGYALGRIGCHIAGDGDWGINNPKPNPFTWLPGWLWSYNYPHNILRRGIYMQGCKWDDYCYQLAVPVYPTPLYELVMGLIIVAILLFALRKEKVAGRVSAYCLMLMGIERFFIEKIRVDIRYNFGSFHPTQAEILSVFCIACGVFLYIMAPRLNANRMTSNFSKV